MSSNTPIVFVNGEVMNLLEDGRLSLYQRFPVGSVLYDPSDLPPREVPFSTTATEKGVTACRLIPNGHYEAYIPDSLTGDLHPVTGESICVYVTGLPPNTTAEMLGRYFEAFDMVAEADVFRTTSGACTGRGWVVLQDPTKLFMVPPVMEFFPRVFIYTALSDRVPTRKMHDSSCAPAAQVFGSGGTSYAISALGNNCSGSHRKINGKVSGGALKTLSTSSLSVAAANFSYFVVLISKENLAKSVEESIFWTSASNHRAFYSTLNRGPVIIIFLLHEYTAIVGYGRLLPMIEADTAGDFLPCSVEWLRHHVFLREEHLKGVQSIPISRMGDGVPLKREIGESICHLADQLPTFSSMSEVLSHCAHGGYHIARGGGAGGNHRGRGKGKGRAAGGGGAGGNNNGAGAMYAAGGRGNGGAPLQQLPGTMRVSGRGSNAIGGNSLAPPRRRLYETSSAFVGHNGGGSGPSRNQ